MTFVGPLQFRISYDSMNKAQKALIVGRCLFVVIVEGLVCVWPSLECTVAVPRHTWSVLGDQPAFPSPPGWVSLLPFLQWWQSAVSLDHGEQFPWACSLFLSRQSGSDTQEVLTTCRGSAAGPASARLAGVKTNVAREGFVWANILSGVCWIPAPAGGSWVVDLLLGNGKGRQEWGVFGKKGPQPEFSRFCGVEKALLGAQAWGGWAPWPSLTPLPSAAAAAASAHFSFCRSLLEHTVSAENLSYRLQRNPGSSLTWHDGRSQRPDGGHTVKLLRQPGTEGSQVPHTPPWARRGEHGSLCLPEHGSLAGSHLQLLCCW